MYRCLLIITLLLPLFGFSQTYNWRVTQSDLNGDEIIEAGTIDDENSFYGISEFVGTYFFNGSTYTPRGITDFLLFKNDSVGNLKAVKQVETRFAGQIQYNDFRDELWYQPRTSSGDSLFYDGEFIIVSNGFADVLILNDSLQLIDTMFFDFAGDIEIINDSLIAGAGIFGGSINFGGTLYTASGLTDGICFVYNINAEQFLWVNQYSGTGRQGANFHKIDGNELVVLVRNEFLDDFTTGLCTSVPVGFAVQHLNSLDGTEISCNTLSNTVYNDLIVSDFEIDEFGNQVFLVSFENDVFWQSNLILQNSTGDNHYAIIKIDNTNNFLWHYEFQFPLSGLGSLRMELLDTGAIALSFSHNVDIPIGSNMIPAIGNNDASIVCLTSSGEINWWHSIATIDFEQQGPAFKSSKGLIASFSSESPAISIGDTAMPYVGDRDRYIFELVPPNPPPFTLGTITSTCLKAGDSIYIPVNGVDIDEFMVYSGNLFIVEVSDEFGGWNSPTQIGFGFDPNQGDIPCQLPLSLPFGTNYRVRVRSTNPHRISPDNGFDLTIKEAFGFSIESDLGLNICFGETGQFFIDVPYASVNWNSGSTQDTISASGNDTIIATIIDLAGCEVISDSAFVNMFPAEVSLSSLGYPGLCLGSSVTYDAAPIPGASYSWNDGQTGLTATFSIPGNYMVTATSPTGCVASSAMIPVTVDQCTLNVKYLIFDYPIKISDQSVSSQGIILVGTLQEPSYVKGYCQILDYEHNTITKWLIGDSISLSSASSAFLCLWSRDGHIYVVGSVSYSGQSGFYLHKYDSLGQLIWETVIEVPSGFLINSINEDADGNVYLSSKDTSTPDIWKVDKNGNTVWLKGLQRGGGFGLLQLSGGSLVGVQDIGITSITNIDTSGNATTIKYYASDGIRGPAKLDTVNQNIYVCSLIGNLEVFDSSGVHLFSGSYYVDSTQSLILREVTPTPNGIAVTAFTPAGKKYVIFLDKTGEVIQGKELSSGVSVDRGYIDSYDDIVVVTWSGVTTYDVLTVIMDSRSLNNTCVIDAAITRGMSTSNVVHSGDFTAPASTFVPYTLWSFNSFNSVSIVEIDSCAVIPMDSILEITSPKALDSICPDEVSIYYYGFGYDRVNIFYSDDNGITYQLIAWNIDALAGYYNWNVPSSIWNTSVRLKIEHLGGVDFFETGEFFLKEKPATPSFWYSGVNELSTTAVSSSYHWLFEGFPFGGNTQSITYSDTGQYALYIEENGCPSDIGYVNVVSVNELELKLGVNVFPNPSIENVNFNIYMSVDSKDYQLKIFAGDGRLMESIEFNSDMLTLNLSDYQSGYYFYHLSDATNHYSQGKFVVLR